ncbi:MAG: hypothetical protein A2Y10_12300 [Planctomycetes bacterium GWF2_41_51]|nr:MAG: hypothetical protein A2Y10_12300 [Planctomycetes bacterium GWF2_41_51]
MGAGKTFFFAGIVLCVFFAAPILVNLNESSLAPIDCKLNPNTASEYELAELPTIGPGRTGAIAEYRKNKRFENMNDIEQVRGIGEKTVRKLEPFLKFEDTD